MFLLVNVFVAPLFAGVGARGLAATGHEGRGQIASLEQQGQVEAVVEGTKGAHPGGGGGTETATASATLMSWRTSVLWPCVEVVPAAAPRGLVPGCCASGSLYQVCGDCWR